MLTLYHLTYWKSKLLHVWASPYHNKAFRVLTAVFSTFCKARFIPNFSLLYPVFEGSWQSFVFKLICNPLSLSFVHVLLKAWALQRAPCTTTSFFRCLPFYPWIISYYNIIRILLFKSPTSPKSYSILKSHITESHLW